MTWIAERTLQHPLDEHASGSRDFIEVSMALTLAEPEAATLAEWEDGRFRH